MNILNNEYPIRSIEIEINSINEEFNIFLDIINYKIKIDDKEKNIEKEWIDDLLRIIRTWKKEYSSSKMLDAESFLIRINSIDGTDIIKGKGDYPENYMTLKKWIGDVIE